MLASLRPQLKRSVVLAGIRDSVIADPARRGVRLRRGVVALVERFDIEPFPDFSAK